MDDDRFQRMKDFLEIGADDEQLVKSLQEPFAEISQEFVDAFYHHLLAFPETARFLTDDRLVNRLKEKQVGFLKQLLSGECDDGFLQDRLRVGETHHQIGLEPRWFVGAFNQYVQFCLPRFATALGGELPAPALSLLKLVMLDIGLVLEAYFAASTAELRARNDELESALQICFEAEVRAQGLAKLAGHEIRGALNSIGNACAEVAEDYADNLPDEARHSMERARDRCWRLMSVVEGILAEPERAGRAEWIDAADVLRDVPERIRLHTDRHDVELRTFEGPVHVWACPVELREVFANLVMNAVRHMDKPAGLIEIEHRDDVDSHIFSVADNGIGIPPEIQPEIFKPFFRGPDAVEGTGRGMGLFFVRRIVERHGGEVWVESVPGCGSRFSFSIPFGTGRA